MKRKVAAGLMTMLLSSAMLLTGPVPAAAESAEAAGDPAPAAEETEQAAEDVAAPRIEVPASRPDYSALDYVKIKDEKYKAIEFSIYPPADDSEEAQTAWQTEVDTEIMTQLFALYPVEEYPEDLLNYVAGSLVQTYRQYSDMYGIDFPAFLQTYLKMDEDTFLKQADTAARQTLKEEMLLKAVAEKEGITVSDEEYESGCEAYAARYGYESADALKQAFDEPTIRISLLMDKTFAWLEKNVSIHLIIETETESETEIMTEAETTAADAAAAEVPGETNAG